MALAERGLGDVSSLVENADALVRNVAGVVVARRELIEHSVVRVLAGGHLLLNDLPGVGKTLLARSLARSLGGSFKRTQSALLESMAEGQVTADGLSYGTFPLPHAQLDRFIMSLSLGYPDAADQTAILEMNQTGDPEAGPVLSGETLVDMQSQVREMAVSRAIREYMAHILVATREHELLRLGASPRRACIYSAPPRRLRPSGVMGSSPLSTYARWRPSCWATA
jgi:MoxR-like ATPase